MPGEYDDDDIGRSPEIVNLNEVRQNMEEIQNQIDFGEFDVSTK